MEQREIQLGLKSTLHKMMNLYIIKYLLLLFYECVMINLLLFFSFVLCR